MEAMIWVCWVCLMALTRDSYKAVGFVCGFRKHDYSRCWMDAWFLCLLVIFVVVGCAGGVGRDCATMLVCWSGSESKKLDRQLLNVHS